MSCNPKDHRCDHPECDSASTIGIGGTVGSPAEWYCAKHLDYGMGRVFGPLHRALASMERAKPAPAPPEEGGQA